MLNIGNSLNRIFACGIYLGLLMSDRRFVAQKNVNNRGFSRGNDA